MKKLSIIGHYGKDKVFLDGQTVKTKILTEELVRRFGEENVGRIDTYGGKKVLPKLILKTIFALKNSENVIILPAHNGLRVFVPILNFFNKIFKRKLLYVVIGGWLFQYLQNKKGLVKKLKKFNGIFVETNSMKTALEEMGFTNIKVMPNCKKLRILSEEELVYPTSEPYKLCTFSRVMKEKGIEDAVNAVKAVNEELGRTVYTLDIYGQIDENQTEWFENLQKDFPEYIKYGGLVAFDQSVEVLKNYFALLFPTYYEGEGFAGTLLDAMSAGVPVIASDWKYNSEIVIDGQTGLLFSDKNLEQLKGCLIGLVKKKEIAMVMKKFCLTEAKKYTVSNIIRILLEQIDRD